jgi:hypothetical protein
VSRAAAGETVDANAPRDQLVLDEARRAIDQQVRDLDGICTRAGNLAGTPSRSAASSGASLHVLTGNPPCGSSRDAPPSWSPPCSPS